MASEDTLRNWSTTSSGSLSCGRDLEVGTRSWDVGHH